MPDELSLPRIRKWMTAYSVSAAMLAKAIGYTSDHMRRVLLGQRRLMPEIHEAIITYFVARKAQVEQQKAAMDELDRCA